VPPAERGAGDDPVVLIEVVAYIRPGLGMGAEPRGEQVGAMRQRHLFQRLGRRTGNDNAGGALGRSGDLRLGLLRHGLRLRSLGGSGNRCDRHRRDR